MCVMLFFGLFDCSVEQHKLWHKFEALALFWLNHTAKIQASEGWTKIVTT